MSTYHKATLRCAALGDPSHPLHLAATELREARVGCSRRRILEPGSKKRDRKTWPEQQRLTAAEREYARVLRAVKTGLNAWGAA